MHEKATSFSRYQVLAVATETKTKEEAQNMKSGKRVAVSRTDSGNYFRYFYANGLIESSAHQSAGGLVPLYR